MDSSSGQHHHQEMEMGGSQTLESMLVCTKSGGVEKKARPADMQAIKCPRCDSSNTKFCYYNNYSLSQPRYFCKSCRRYWTKGGTLRNVPVGGGCRKNKRSSSSSTTTSNKNNNNNNNPSLPAIPNNNNNNINPYDHSNNDLALAIAGLRRQTASPLDDHFSIWGNNHHHLGAGFLDNPQSLYYNNNNNIGLEMGMGGAQEMGGGTPFEDFSSVKQEGVMGRVLWGFPWHNNTAGDADGPDLDSTRSLVNWNSGIAAAAASNWHGLLNTPLM